MQIRGWIWYIWRKKDPNGHSLKECNIEDRWSPNVKQQRNRKRCSVRSDGYVFSCHNIHKELTKAMCLHIFRKNVTWIVIAVRKILTFALLGWSKSCKIEDYNQDYKAHCSSIIWHDIIWRPPKTEFWVNFWKYFETGTTFLAEIRLRGGWLGWKLFFRKMLRDWFWTIFISGRNQIAWLVFIFLGWKRF